MKHTYGSQGSSGVGSQFQQAAKRRTDRKKRKTSPPFSIRFSDEELARLNRDAGTLSLAAYIRLKLLCDAEGPAPKRNLTRKQHKPSAELAVLGHMLGGLGKSRLASNINQIAKAANVGELPVTPELEHELHKACEVIQTMRQDLISALGVKSK